MSGEFAIRQAFMHDESHAPRPAVRQSIGLEFNGAALGGGGRFMEMSKGLILAVWFARSAFAFAGFDGKILDERKAPVEGATVTIWDAKSGKGLRTKTAAGRFAFRDVKEGDYLLKVEKDGAAVIYGAVQLKGDLSHELNPILVDSPNAGEEVIRAGLPFREPAADGAPSAVEPKKVRGAKIIRRVRPTYPPDAKQRRASGMVRMSASIRADGRMDNPIVLTAPSRDFALAALVAVRQWRYSPTYLDDKAVDVQTTIDVNFELKR